MFFYDYEVADSHLFKFESEMQVRFLSGKTAKRAELTGHLEIHSFVEPQSKELIYFIIDSKENSVLGFCDLKRITRMIALETTMLYINSEARGRNLAMLLYDTVLSDGIILASGQRQNPGSKGLWMKLVKNRKYVTWAHDLKNLKRVADITVEDDDFDCSLTLYRDLKYSRNKQKEDIRILAINPGCV